VALRALARQPASYGGALLLLILTLSLAIFSAAAATLDKGMRRSVAYNVGVAAQLIETGESTERGSADGSSARRTSTEEPRFLFVPRGEHLFGLLSIGFVAAGLLTVLGFLTATAITARRRVIELGVLRAIGLSGRSAGAALAIEQGVLVLAGVAIGASVGLVCVWLVVPALQVGVGPPLLGADLARLGAGELATLRRRMGLIFQSFALLPAASAYENVELGLRLSGGVPREQWDGRVRASLEALGLGPWIGHRPYELSGGQQRVAITRALVSSPELIVADEPTGDLDAATGRRVIGLLRSLAERAGTTVLLATHDPAATHHLELKDGRQAGLLGPGEWEVPGQKGAA